MEGGKIICNKFIYFCVFLGSGSYISISLCRSPGELKSLIMPNNSTLYSLFTLSAPRNISTLCCQLWDVKSDATFLLARRRSQSCFGGPVPPPSDLGMSVWDPPSDQSKVKDSLAPLSPRGYGPEALGPLRCPGRTETFSLHPSVPTAHGHFPNSPSSGLGASDQNSKQMLPEPEPAQGPGGEQSRLMSSSSDSQPVRHILAWG